jgi:hypothetical protein
MTRQFSTSSAGPSLPHHRGVLSSFLVQLIEETGFLNLVNQTQIPIILFRETLGLRVILRY